MKIRFTIFLFIALINWSCNHPKAVENVYRYYWGEKDGYKVWIIDGNTVRSKIYNEFLYGGNEQRYPFVPKGEIWIDHAISSEEFDLTLAHELNERHLMAKYGWPYDRAHDSSLALEVVLRRKFKADCLLHEATLLKRKVMDCLNTKEIKDIPDSIELHGIYRIPLGERNGINVWVVDGYKVRAEIFPDFGLSGNDIEYLFIPPKEIWIDGQVSCEETEYSIANEMMERELMLKGVSYGQAYDSTIDENTRKRQRMYSVIRLKHPIVIPDSITREHGTINPMEPGR